MVAVHYFPVDGIGLAQQLVGLFHIAFFQLLTDIGAADVTPVVLFLFYDMEMITQVTGHGREQLCAASALVAKAAVRAYHDFPGMHAACQNVLYKGFRLHMACFLGKGVFHQIINPHLLHVGPALQVGGDDGLGLSRDCCSGSRSKGEDGCGIPSLCLQLHHGSQ